MSRVGSFTAPQCKCSNNSGWEAGCRRGQRSVMILYFKISRWTTWERSAEDVKQTREPVSIVTTHHACVSSIADTDSLSLAFNLSAVCSICCIVCVALVSLTGEAPPNAHWRHFNLQVLLTVWVFDLKIGCEVTEVNSQHTTMQIQWYFDLGKSLFFSCMKKDVELLCKIL